MKVTTGLVLFGSPMILLVGLVIYRVLHPSPVQLASFSSPNVAFIAPQKQLLKKWSDSTFSPIENNSNLADQLKTVPISGAELDETQRQGLYDAFANLLLANYLGAYDAFRKFQTPETDFEFSQSAADFLKEQLKKSAPDIDPNNKEAVLKFYWDRFIQKNHAQFWSGLDMTNATIFIQKDSSTKINLEAYLKSRENLGLAQVGPTVIPRPEPSEVIKHTGTMTWALIGFVANNSDMPYPIYCVLFWDDGAKKWIPNQLAAAYSGPHTKFLFF